MEKVFLAPEELQSKFKSKRCTFIDYSPSTVRPEINYKLYSGMVFTNIWKMTNEFLAPTPISRKEGSWQRSFNLIQHLCVSDVKLFHIPNYKQLSTKELWKLVREVEDLMIYWPDYGEGTLPGKEFIVGIISTLKPEETEILIEETRKKRSVSNEEDVKGLVSIEKNIKDEIFGVFTQKGNY